MRSIGERGLVAMRAPSQRGQVARMSDRENSFCHFHINSYHKCTFYYDFLN